MKIRNGSRTRNKGDIALELTAFDSQIEYNKKFDVYFQFQHSS